jgi:dephospho-CoA kinase
VLRVGLTGAAGAGKSTVARGLAERGFPVLDADKVAHELYLPGSLMAESIIRVFGAGVRSVEGGIDRAALGAIVFADRARREALDALVHPPLLAELRRRLDALAGAGHEAAVLEAALLLRWGPPDFVDLVVGVSAPRPVRRGRLLAQGLAPADVERRIDLQVDEDDLARRADFIVVNDGDLDRLMRGIDDLAAYLRRRARGEG